MTAAPQPGDEVLVRARVESVTSSGDLLVDFQSKTHRRVIWVREDLVAEVIPAARTKTHAGHTVTATREAIAKVDRLIEVRDPDQSPAGELLMEALREMRAGLVAELTAIGVPVEETL